jgi:hypothetical protein
VLPLNCSCGNFSAVLWIFVMVIPTITCFCSEIFFTDYIVWSDIQYGWVDFAYTYLTTVHAVYEVANYSINSLASHVW